MGGAWKTAALCIVTFGTQRIFLFSSFLRKGNDYTVQLYLHSQVQAKLGSLFSEACFFVNNLRIFRKLEPSCSRDVTAWPCTRKTSLLTSLPTALLSLYIIRDPDLVTYVLGRLTSTARGDVTWLVLPVAHELTCALAVRNMLCADLARCVISTEISVGSRWRSICFAIPCVRVRPSPTISGDARHAVSGRSWYCMSKLWSVFKSSICCVITFNFYNYVVTISFFY